MEFNESFWKLKKSIDEIVGYKTSVKQNYGPHVNLVLTSDNGTLLGTIDLYLQENGSWRFGGKSEFLPEMMWGKLGDLND